MSYKQMVAATLLAVYGNFKFRDQFAQTAFQHPSAINVWEGITGDLHTRIHKPARLHFLFSLWKNYLTYYRMYTLCNKNQGFKIS
jgi:hypothetical protein